MTSKRTLALVVIIAFFFGVLSCWQFFYFHVPISVKERIVHILVQEPSDRLHRLLLQSKDYTSYKSYKELGTYLLVSEDTTKIYDSPCCGDTSIVVTVWCDSVWIVENCEINTIQRGQHDH
jgi:hypothetical protein